MLKKIYIKLKERSIHQEILLLLLASFIFTWNLFVSTPTTIVTSNLDEFTYISGGLFILYALLYAIAGYFILIIFYLIISFIVKKYIRKFFLYLIISFSLSTWLNSAFLITSYGPLDGRDSLNISPFGFLNWIQLTFFVVIFLLCIVFNKRVKIQSYILIAISIIILSTSVINSFVIFSRQGSTKLLDDAEFFIYSKNNPNLLFIILDQYQSDYFADILDDDLKEELKGFIWFEDTSSNFTNTQAAMPAIFTGEIYDNSIDLKNFYSEIQDKSIARKFHSQTGRFNSLQASFHYSYLFPEKTNLKVSLMDQEGIDSYSIFINYSLFRIVPDILKNRVFNNGDWLIKIDSGTDSLTSSVIKSFKILDYISNKKINVIDGPSQFKYHRSLATHNPVFSMLNCTTPYEKVEYTFENRSKEGKCVIEKIVKVVKNLKKQDVFDNTMIIISSDHGATYNIFSDPAIPYASAASTLLIKPLNSKSDFIISDFPAQLSDIPKTIANEFSITDEYDGINLLGQNKTTNRVRIYNYYKWTKEYFTFTKARVPPITQYRINGPLKSLSSWKKALPCDFQLDFSDKESVQYYYSEGLSHIESFGRWSNGSFVELSFQLEPDCDTESVAFNFNAYVPTGNPTQIASVSINDEYAGSISISRGESRPKQFVFSLPETDDRKYTFHFEIEIPVSPASLGRNNDMRELGFSFLSMELLSD